MTLRHDDALMLAATAVDWPLAPDERAELDGHLTECHACALAAAKLQRQASMLTFIDMFRLLGVIFIVLIPLVFLMRRPLASQPVAAAVE